MCELQRTTATPPAIRGVWDIDPGHSSVELVARHLVSGVRGRFAEFGGPLGHVSRRHRARLSAGGVGVGSARGVV
jgi:polyisoprenoid-binding protein YceI